MQNIHIGIYGLWRGASLIDPIGGFDGVQVTALCEKDEGPLMHVTGQMPFFDVYRGAPMSAVGILAWRSFLENGKTFALPDFGNKADRDAIRDDALTPFPDENGHATLPCAAGKAVNGR